jgi:hypothetical protein
MSEQPFTPCPLSVERCTEDDCIEVITTSRIVAKDPWTDVRYDACEVCASKFDNWEPSDDDLYNGPGMEGGVSYREEDTPRYQQALKDAGRR